MRRLLLSLFLVSTFALPPAHAKEAKRLTQWQAVKLIAVSTLLGAVLAPFAEPATKSTQNSPNRPLKARALKIKTSPQKPPVTKKPVRPTRPMRPGRSR